MVRRSSKAHEDTSFSTTEPASPVRLKPPPVALSRATTADATPSTSTIHRRVQFSTDPEMIHLIPHVDEYSAHEHQTLFWTQDDFKAFRLAAKTSAVDARLDCRSSIDTGYTTAHFLAVDAEESFLDLELADVSLHIRDLCKWTRLDHARGCEHWTSQRHWQARDQALYDSRRAVLGQTSCEKAYQQATKASRILARLLGEADANEAMRLYQLGDGPDEEQQQVMKALLG